MFTRIANIVLFTLCMFNNVLSEIQSISYEDGNLDSLFSNSRFTITPYSGINNDYHVAIPPNGPESGGVFSFDVPRYLDSNVLAITSINKHVDVQLSFFCDKLDTLLTLSIDYKVMVPSLCGEEDSHGIPGNWTVINLSYYCHHCLKVNLNFRGNSTPGSVLGIEGMVVVTDESTLPPINPTTEDTSTTSISTTNTSELSTSTLSTDAATSTLEPSTPTHGIGCYSCFDCPVVDESTPVEADPHFYSCFTATMSSGEVTYVFRGGSDKHHMDGSCRQEDGTFTCYCNQDKCNFMDLEPSLINYQQ